VGKRRSSRQRRRGGFLGDRLHLPARRPGMTAPHPLSRR
jgi:hypothetical protein